MTNIDFSPLFRSMIGFDRMSSALETAYRSEPGGYPPYNIEASGENDYRITMAVAGFTEKDLALEVKENILTVSGARAATRTGDNPSSSIAVSPTATSSVSSSLPTMSGSWMRGWKTVCCMSTCVARSRRR